MAKTNTSHTATFCPVDEFLKRFDVRAIAQLAADDNTPVATGSLASNANVLAALRSASGYFESAALLGEKYTTLDLVALLSTDTNARAMMYDLVAGFAFTRLRERRPDRNVPKSIPEERAENWLEQLVDGKRIFGFQETMDAGVLDSEVEAAATVEQRHLSTTIAQAYFGTRGNRWNG